MPAPKGNQFWKMRSKHGRDRIFETPQILWEAACEYFEWCDNNPLQELDYVGKDATEVIRYKMIPYTLEGLCIHLQINTKYFNHFDDSLKDREDERSKEFSNIITRIREIIRCQKFTGAASGFFNANIIAREMGMGEKIEQEIKMESKQVFQIGDTIIEM